MRRRLTRTIATTGILVALAVVLSFLENALIPVPGLPPGARLGLSNVVIMAAAAMLGPAPAMTVAAAKGIFAGVTRGLTAGMMSLSGGLLSAAALCLLLCGRRHPFGWVGIGVAGALCHNFGQFAAAFALAGSGIVSYLPALMLFALPAGTATGLTLSVLHPSLRRIRSAFLE